MTRLGVCPVDGPAPDSQMTLFLQVALLCSEVLALVLWARPLGPLLKEELRATGRSRDSRRCHWHHFFRSSSCTCPRDQPSAVQTGTQRP